MTLQDCSPSRYYKRPHWTDYFIKYSMPKMDWEYDNGSLVGSVVRQIDDLIECDSNCNPKNPAPVKVTYNSNEEYDLIVCKFQNSIKEYEYKILKGTPLTEDQPLVTETGGKLSIATFCRRVTETQYPEHKLSWIYGTVNPLRNSKDSAANDIISSIVNRGTTS